MKTSAKVYGFLMMIICLSCNAANSENQNYNQNDTVQLISEIKKKYAKINSEASSYEKVVKDLYDESSEGASITGYYSGRKLKKISGTYYGETGKSFVEYYYDGSNFFFVYSRESSYVVPLYVDRRGKVNEVKEDRFYFNNGELVKWISGGKNVPADSNDFLERNKIFKVTFEKYRKIFDGQK